jgi:hypothetical protein
MPHVRRSPRGEIDEDDLCEHGIVLWEFCPRCEGDGEALFDADELGLDPELDDTRGRDDARHPDPPS